MRQTLKYRMLMFKSIFSLFKKESAEQKKARLESEVSEIESKLARIDKGITMNIDPGPLRKKLFFLLGELAKLRSVPKAESPK